MFSALRESNFSEISSSLIWKNSLAGITVGIIALPLSMALAIATGVTPERGIYTAIIAGIFIALSGGSRTSISGPTAAFIVILLPIVEKHGVGGLLLSGFLAGIILVLMSWAKLGTLIQVVPYPVTIGFTSGIGVVIASLQFKDLLGLTTNNLDGHFIPQIKAAVEALPSLQIQDSIIGLITLATLISLQICRTKLPSHLIALLVGSLIASLLSVVVDNFNVATINSRFAYTLDGQTFPGIAPFLPEFTLPWNLPDQNGLAIGLSFELIRTLLGPAFAIAMLGALESLLCAVVADGMTGTRHNPNDELFGQGIGNIVVPFFGGIPATAALARTAANIRAGGNTPLSSVIHSVFLVLAILLLAPLLGYIPMASLAALLLVIAWNMAEAKHFIKILRVAPKADVWTMLTCFSLTVLLDMEVAIAVGIALAGLLFIKRTVELTNTKLIEQRLSHHLQSPNPNILVYDIDGPLFFGTARKALSEISKVKGEIKAVILDLTDVTMIDMTAMIALESITQTLSQSKIQLVICNAQNRIVKKLEKLGLEKEKDLIFASDLDQAFKLAESAILAN